MNDTVQRLRRNWEPPALSQPGNPPKMAFPDNGRLERPVNWTQTVYGKGLQGNFRKIDPPWYENIRS